MMIINFKNMCWSHANIDPGKRFELFLIKTIFPTNYITYRYLVWKIKPVSNTV